MTCSSLAQISGTIIIFCPFFVLFCLKTNTALSLRCLKTPPVLKHSHNIHARVMKHRHSIHSRVETLH